MKFEIPAEEMYRALESTHRALYSGTDHRAIAYLAVEATTDQVIFVATNGHYLVQYTYDMPGQNEHPGVVMLAKQDVKALRDILKAHKTSPTPVQWSLELAKLTIGHPSGAFTATNLGSDYPDWRRVVEARPSGEIPEITIGIELLGQVVLCVKAAQVKRANVSKNHVPSINFTFGEDELTPVTLLSGDAPNLRVVVCPVVSQ